MGQDELSMGDHSAYLREGRTKVQTWSVLRAEEALAETLVGAPVQDARHLRRSTMTGARLNVQPSTVNGTELGAQKWRDSLFLRYVLDPPELPKIYDGCNTAFSICHSLNCKWGGLFKARHNNLRDGVTDLSGKAFTPTHVREKPLIFAGCTVKKTTAKPSTSKTTPPTKKLEAKKKRATY